jgi:hypothetical protein
MHFIPLRVLGALQITAAIILIYRIGSEYSKLQHNISCKSVISVYVKWLIFKLLRIKDHRHVKFYNSAYSCLSNSVALCDKLLYSVRVCRKSGALNNINKHTKTYTVPLYIRDFIPVCKQWQIACRQGIALCYNLTN